MASRHASVTEEQNFIDRRNRSMYFKFWNLSFYSSFFEFFDHLRRRDFHFLLCVIIAVTQILDRLIIQIVWYILKQLFTSVSVEVVDIYPHLGE